MNANANRREAGSNRLSLGSYVPDSVEGTPARQRWCNRISAAVLEAADACDERAGIYRVSLDAAVEAAAEQDCEDWANCHVKDVHRTWARKALTAAVTGGAQ